MKPLVALILLFGLPSNYLHASEVKFLCEGWHKSILGEESEISTLITIEGDTYFSISMNQNSESIFADGFAEVGENFINLYEKKIAKSLMHKVNRISGELFLSRYAAARSSAYQITCEKAVPKF